MVCTGFFNELRGRSSQVLVMLLPLELAHCPNRLLVRNLWMLHRFSMLHRQESSSNICYMSICIVAAFTITLLDYCDMYCMVETHALGQEALSLGAQAWARRLSSSSCARILASVHAAARVARG